VSRLPDPEQEPVPEPPEPSGNLRTTGPGVLVTLGLVGLVGGWALRPVSIRLSATAPTVGWGPVLALVLVAAILGAVAWTTYRTLQTRRDRIEPQQAVNRLVLAKACALTGAVIAGGYLGYALSWVGMTETELGEQRLVRSLVAGVAGLLIVTASLTLERACRIRRDDDENLR
jgi:uncharacterized membrane protein